VSDLVEERESATSGAVSAVDHDYGQILVMNGEATESLEGNLRRLENEHTAVLK
jgi:hypothetical protein